MQEYSDVCKQHTSWSWPGIGVVVSLITSEVMGAIQLLLWQSCNYRPCGTPNSDRNTCCGKDHVFQATVFSCGKPGEILFLNFCNRSAIVFDIQLFISSNIYMRSMWSKLSPEDNRSTMHVDVVLHPVQRSQLGGEESLLISCPVKC